METKMTSSPSRKAPLYLTDTEYYSVYKYCIEHKCVIQNGNTMRYRVVPRDIAEEINGTVLLGDKKLLSEHHVRKSIETVMRWQELLDLVPEPKATVYEDQLVAEIKQKDNEIESYKLEIKKLKQSPSNIELLKQLKIKCAELNHILHTSASLAVGSKIS